MIKSIFIAAPLLACAAAFAAAPLVADEPMTVQGNATRIIHQERVSYTDLDLRNGSDRAALRRRVRVAADGICDRLASLETGVADSDIRYCANVAYDTAQPQVRSAIHAASSGQQLAMTIMISGPVLTR